MAKYTYLPTYATIFGKINELLLVEIVQTCLKFCTSRQAIQLS